MRKGLTQVLFANIISLFIGLIYGFILPRYLSIETFAMIKTYTLLISFAGVFHLGYLDGMYLEYGGRVLNDIHPNELGTDFKNIFAFQCFISFVVFIIGVVFNNYIVVTFSIGILLINLISTFQMFYQAIGDFKQYGKALNIRNYLMFLSSMFLVFLFDSDNYVHFIFVQLFSAFLALIYLIYSLQKNVHFLKMGKTDVHQISIKISTGFILMIGNFSSILITAIDRVFVKFLLSTIDFAVYSFAVGINSLVTVFITPISITLYNTLCKENDNEAIKTMKRMILIWGFMVTSMAYPAVWLVSFYISHYSSAIPIIYLLFSTQVFYAIIKGVYINLYKARKMQKAYLVQMISIVIVSIVLNIALYLLFRNAESFAFATLITSFLWLIICELGSMQLSFAFQEWFYILVLLVTFLLTGMFLNPFLGLFVFLITFVVLSFVFMRKPFLLIIHNIIEIIPIKSNRGSR